MIAISIVYKFNDIWSVNLARVKRWMFYSPLYIFSKYVKQLQRHTKITSTFHSWNMFSIERHFQWHAFIIAHAWSHLNDRWFSQTTAEVRPCMNDKSHIKRIWLHIHVSLSSVKSHDIYLRALSSVNMKTLISETRSKVSFYKSHSHLRGANKLSPAHTPSKYISKGVLCMVYSSCYVALRPA